MFSNIYLKEKKNKFFKNLLTIFFFNFSEFRLLRMKKKKKQILPTYRNLLKSVSRECHEITNKIAEKMCNERGKYLEFDLATCFLVRLLRSLPPRRVIIEYNTTLLRPANRETSASI